MEDRLAAMGLNQTRDMSDHAESSAEPCHDDNFTEDFGTPETEHCAENSLDLLLYRVKHCRKNPGHKEFYTVESFGLRNLPPEFQDERIVHYLRLFSRLTVRLTVGHTSEDRTGVFVEHRGRKRFATGFAWLPSETSMMPCPIPDCPYGQQTGDAEDGGGNCRPHFVYGYIRVLTNKHVVYNESEAAATEGIFWDDEVHVCDSSSPTYSAPSRRIPVQCVGVDYSQEDNDTAHLRCVTHDPLLCGDLQSEMARLKQTYSSIPVEVWQAADLCVTVSHPHGMRKVITVGRHMGVEETGSGAHAHFHSCATCPGSSGAPVLYTHPGLKGAQPMWLPAIHSYYLPKRVLSCAFK